MGNYTYHDDWLGTLRDSKTGKAYMCIDAYKEVDNPDEWLDCPNCGNKPLEWRYDNGRSTACGCGNTIYDHLHVDAESIMSHINRSPNGQSTVGYDTDELRKNWNHWVKTGEKLFDKDTPRKDGRW